MYKRHPHEKANGFPPDPNLALAGDGKLLFFCSIMARDTPGFTSLQSVWRATTLLVVVVWPWHPTWLFGYTHLVCLYSPRLLDWQEKCWFPASMVPSYTQRVLIMGYSLPHSHPTLKPYRFWERTNQLWTTVTSGRWKTVDDWVDSLVFWRSNPLCFISAVTNHHLHQECKH